MNTVPEGHPAASDGSNHLQKPSQSIGGQFADDSRPRLPAAIHLGLGSPAGRNRPAIPSCAESQLTQGEHEVALVIDLAPTLEERCRMLDHVDEAIADIRRLIAPMKQKRRRRQLRLPFVERRKKSRVLRA